MRIAAFADIHGNLAALEAVLADIAPRAVDQIVCLGDIAGLGPFPGPVIDRVRSLDCAVVQGNIDTWHQEPLPADWQPTSEHQVLIHDSYLWLKRQLSPEQISYLHGLPADRLIGPVLCVHGSPRDQREAIFPDTAEGELKAMAAGLDPSVQLILFGHTHRPMQRKVGSLTFAGAGSVGLPADGDPRPCYALVEQTTTGWQVQWPRPAYDVEAAIAAAQSSDFPHTEKVSRAWRSGLGLV